PGLGLHGRCVGRRLRISKPGFAAELGSWAAPAVPDDNGQSLLLGDQTGPIAWFVLNDRLRSDAGALIDALKRRGMRRVLLSGDHAPVVERMAAELGISEAVGNATPADTLAFVHHEPHRGDRVLMLGAGVNA